MSGDNCHEATLLKPQVYYRTSPGTGRDGKGDVKSRGYQQYEEVAEELETRRWYLLEATVPSYNLLLVQTSCLENDQYTAICRWRSASILLRLWRVPLRLWLLCPAFWIATWLAYPA